MTEVRIIETARSETGLSYTLPQEHKPPIKPTTTSKVIPPKEICSDCAPRLFKLEREYAEELRQRHVDWKRFVQYTEDEHAKKVKALEDELEGWKKRFKIYERFAIDFANLTAPWGQECGEQ